MAVRGIDRVRRNVRAFIENVQGSRSQEAVHALLSQGMALSQTMIPIDTSTLINSAYAPQITYNGEAVSGYIGFTAAYALSVHEASGALAGTPRANGNGNYWGPAGEPQFLRRGFEQLMPSIPVILRSIYRVG